MMRKIIRKSAWIVGAMIWVPLFVIAGGIIYPFQRWIRNTAGGALGLYGYLTDDHDEQPKRRWEPQSPRDRFR